MPFQAMKDQGRKVVVVTGASKGLGAEIARKFGAEGCFVVIDYKNDREAAERVLGTIRESGGDGEVCQCDVSDLVSVRRFIEEIQSRHESIGVVVNNAGVCSDALVCGMKESQWDEVIQTNLGGVFNMCKVCAPTMTKQREGCIINISSLSGIEGRAGQANYSASKSAVIGFSKSLAREIGRFGVRVNVVVPGFLDTPMTHPLSESAKKTILSRNILPRKVTPHDVAEFTYFLSTQDNISGQVFHIDNRIVPT